MLIGHEPWHSLSLPASASSRLWFAFPKGMQGIAIVMVTAALLSLAFMGFIIFNQMLPVERRKKHEVLPMRKAVGE